MFSLSFYFLKFLKLKVIGDGQVVNLCLPRAKSREFESQSPQIKLGNKFTVLVKKIIEPRKLENIKLWQKQKKIFCICKYNKKLEQKSNL